MCAVFVCTWYKVNLLISKYTNYSRFISFKFVGATSRTKREREREAKSALMYFQSCQTLCVVPLKYVKEGNAKQEGDWVMVFLPQEKHKGDQRAQIV